MGFGLLIIIGVIALLVAESKGSGGGGGGTPALPPPQPPPGQNVNAVAHYSVISNDNFLGEFPGDPDLKAFFDDSTPEHSLPNGAHVVLLLTSDLAPHNNWIPQPAVVTQAYSSDAAPYVVLTTLTQEPGGPPVGTTFSLSTDNEIGGYFDSTPQGPIPQIVTWLNSHAVSGAQYA